MIPQLPIPKYSLLFCLDKTVKGRKRKLCCIVIEELRHTMIKWLRGRGKTCTRDRVWTQLSWVSTLCLNLKKIFNSRSQHIITVNPSYYFKWLMFKAGTTAFFLHHLIICELHFSPLHIYLWVILSFSSEKIAWGHYTNLSHQESFILNIPNVCIRFLQFLLIAKLRKSHWQKPSGIIIMKNKQYNIFYSSRLIIQLGANTINLSDNLHAETLLKGKWVMLWSTNQSNSST